MTTQTATTTRTASSRHLALGLERLRAIKVGTRYHYYADETCETYSVTASEVRLLGRMIAEEEAETGHVCWAYSEWCAATDSRIVRG
jgi:hypothetical protein